MVNERRIFQKHFNSSNTEEFKKIVTFKPLLASSKEKIAPLDVLTTTPDQFTELVQVFSGKSIEHAQAVFDLNERHKEACRQIDERLGRSDP